MKAKWRGVLSTSERDELEVSLSLFLIFLYPSVFLFHLIKGFKFIFFKLDNWISLQWKSMRTYMYSWTSSIKFMHVEVFIIKDSSRKIVQFFL